MAEQTIGFLGAGNMASFLVGGLVADGYSASKLHVSHPKQEQLDLFHKQYGVHTHTSNLALTKTVEVLVLCVKPQRMPTVCDEIAPILADKTCLILSIAAGISLPSLQSWLGSNQAIIRCMPNTPALVRCAATALIANNKTRQTEKDVAESLMRAIGITQWVDDEKHMDIITALSGSGPAYYYYVMEALSNAAIDAGLPESIAQLFTMQTALGAAKLAL